MIIRNETESDINAISDVTRAAFANLPISNHTEQFIIDALRASNAGIGRSLIQEGLSRLNARGAEGCILVGDPGYYERFGFRSVPELTHEGVPQENVLVLPFDGNKARGVVEFHRGFWATS